MNFVIKATDGITTGLNLLFVTMSSVFKTMFITRQMFLRFIVISSLCSLSVQFQIEENRIIANGFRIESYKSPGLFLGIKNQSTSLYHNLTYNLYTIEGNFSPSNETLWTVVRVPACDYSNNKGYSLNLFSSPEFRLGKTKSGSVQLTATGEPACFIPVYKVKNGSFHLLLGEISDGRKDVGNTITFLKQMKNSSLIEYSSQDDEESFFDSSFHWLLRYNGIP